MARRVRTFTATITILVDEDLDSTWHKPFTEAQAKRLVHDLLPGPRSFITGGAYSATVRRVTLRASEPATEDRNV